VQWPERLIEFPFILEGVDEAVDVGHGCPHEVQAAENDVRVRVYGAGGLQYLLDAVCEQPSTSISPWGPLMARVSSGSSRVRGILETVYSKKCLERLR